MGERREGGWERQHCHSGEEMGYRVWERGKREDGRESIAIQVRICDIGCGGCLNIEILVSNVIYHLN